MLGKISSRFGFLCLALALTACGSTGSVVGNSISANRLPDWVRDPYTRYNRQAYVAVRGSGSSSGAAEISALGNLVSEFGRTVQVNETLSTSYREMVRNGVTTNWSENTAVDDMVSTSSSLESLVGGQIGDIWRDGATYYAVAILDKAKATQTYSEVVRSNQAMIDNLLNIPAAERNTMEGYARYQFAATVADVTKPYVDLLSYIGAPPQGFKRGDDYRLEALNITKAIPVALNVQNDRAGRIEGAFAKALSDLGFLSGGNNSRYALNVNIVISDVEIANSPYEWARIVVNANLSDTSSMTVLLPYNYNSREGFTTQAEAYNRAYMAAERDINEKYAGVLSDYLNKLLPKR